MLNNVEKPRQSCRDRLHRKGICQMRGGRMALSCTDSGAIRKQDAGVLDWQDHPMQKFRRYVYEPSIANSRRPG